MEIRLVGRKRGGSRATNKFTEPRAGRRGKKGVEDTSAGEGAKSRDFWTVKHMIALIRPKRDQDLHLAGLGHNSGRMKTKTWKWDDVEKRLVQMGVTSRKAVDCGKKWDNLYQQFKTVLKFMGESGKPNFFTLTPGERKERGFDFQMDERVYSEMTAMSRGDHTIHPTTLADTGVAGGVQMADPRGGRNEYGGNEGCGDGLDDDQGSMRDSMFSGGGGGRGGKQKNVRQQTFDTIADVMKEYRNLMATTVDSASKRPCSILTRQCDILEEQLSAIKQSVIVGAAGALPRTPKVAGVVITEALVPRQLPAVEGQAQPRQPLPLQQTGASGGGKTPSAQKGEATASGSRKATASGSRKAAADHSTRSRLAEGAEEGRIDDVRRDDGRRDGKREGDDNDDHPLVTRLKGAEKEDDLEERSKLWVDCDTFWRQGPRKPLREAVGDCADYFVAIADGDAGAEPPSMLIIPPNDVPRFKIEDPAQCEPALRRACSVGKLVLRIVHGWFFKSSSRSIGFARASPSTSLRTSHEQFGRDLNAPKWRGLQGEGKHRLRKRARRRRATDHSTRTGLAESAEEGRVDRVRRDDGGRDGKREGDDDDDRPLVTRLKEATKEDSLEEWSKLWVDCDAFWGQGAGKPLREAVGDCADYFVAIANGDAGAEPSLMPIMSRNDVPRFKIEDPGQREPALCRARSVEKLVLRTVHGCIFKSSSRSIGFARAESYITVDFATDVAQAVWQGFKWSKVVSPALVYHTLAMKMDVPLWFAGVKIVDRPEDDDMAARQEATVLRLADCWTYAVWCGQWADETREVVAACGLSSSVVERMDVDHGHGW
ncbi:hypothetical protein CBR_g51424 [Chara braunii]|uniref:Myb/SANT-like DNA-binding domain-containing protein n=1 Tax=Chara braunii TaxID=69332 RepID=A0A388K683_CHABU|nr:hypothetical protein CBR_g51424 [Chara braunii]|eukprot:GBG65541.1 hypothetical protein CBR_g51424 [Chara braunii]